MAADAVLDVQVNIANEEALANSLASALQKRLTPAFRQIGSDLADSLRKAIGDGFKSIKSSNMASSFDAIAASAKEAGASIGSLGEFIDALSRRQGAIRRILTDEAAEASAAGDMLQKDLKALADEFARIQGTMTQEQRRQYEIRLKLLTQNRMQEQTISIRALQALVDAERNAAVMLREQQSNLSRERIERLRADSRREVVERQFAGAQQLIEARRRSAALVNIQKTASRLIVESVRIAGQQIRALERGIGNSVAFLARGVEAALRGVGRSVAGLGSIFRRQSKEVDEANNEIVASTRRSLTIQERIVTESYTRQESVIRSFASNASSAIGGIGLGKLAFGALGGTFLADSLRRGFDRFATIQEATRGLTILLGDAAKAGELLDNVLNVVRGTPFPLDQFADAAAQLVTFQVEARKIPRILQAIADAAALKGSRAPEFVDRLIDVFGQISTQGRITGQEVNRLADAGVNALAILGNAYGKTTLEISEMISEGMVPAKRALHILTEGIINGTEGVNGLTTAFGGLAKGLGETARGAIANFGAARARLGAAIIKPFGDAIVVLFNGLSKIVDQVGRAFAAVASTIANDVRFRAALAAFKEFTDGLKDRVDDLLPMFRLLGDALRVAVAAFTVLASPKIIKLVVNSMSAIWFAVRRLLTPFNILALSVGLVVAAAKLLSLRFADLRDAASRVGSAIVSALSSPLESLKAAFGAVRDAVTDTLRPALVSLAKSGLEFITARLNDLEKFIRTRVAPALEQFANIIRDKVAPVIRRGLARALEFVRPAFDAVKRRVEPLVEVIGTNLVRAAGFAKRAFGAVVDFLRDEVIPVISDTQRAVAIGTSIIALSLITRLGPAAVAIGALVAGFALLERATGFSIVKALEPAIEGFKRLGESIKAAFSGDFSNLTSGLSAAGSGILKSLRNIGRSLAEALAPVRERISEFFKEAFSEENLKNAALNVLRFVERVGRILGDIVSDKRLLAAVAGIGLAAAALAAAFVKGFAEGVINNLFEIRDAVGRLVDTLRKELLSALLGSFTNAFATALFAGLIGVLVVTWKRAGAKSAQVYSVGFFEGAANTLKQLPSFFGTFFGGIEKAAERSQKNIRLEFQRTNREIRRLGGSPVAAFRTVDESALREAKDRLSAMREELTAGQQAALRFQNTVREFGSVIRTAGSGVVDVFKRDFKGALVSFEVAAKKVGTMISDAFARAKAAGVSGAEALGIAIGAAFGAALSGQIAGQADNLVGALVGLGGVATSALGALAVPGIGPALAGVTALVGGLSFAFARNAAAAKRAKAEIKEYADALRGVEDPAERVKKLAEQLFTEITGNEKASAALIQLGKNVDDIAESFAKGVNPAEQFEQRILGLLRTQGFAELLKDVDDVNEAYNRIRSSFVRANRDGITATQKTDEAFKSIGFSIDEVRALLKFLGAEFDQFQKSGAELELEQKLRRGADAGSALSAAIAAAREKFVGFQEEAVRSEFDKKIADSERKVGDLTTQLNDAKQAVFDLFSAAIGGNDLERAIDDAVLAIPTLTSGLQQATQSPFSEAATREAIRGFTDRISEAVGTGVRTGAVTSAEEAKDLIAPILASLAFAPDIDPAAKQKIIDDVLAALEAPDFTASIEKVEGLDEALTTAQEEVDKLKLEFDVELMKAQAEDAATKSAMEAAAALAAQRVLFERAGINMTEGFSEGLVRPGALATLRARARELARAAMDEIAKETEQKSPSRAAMRLGANVTVGFAMGIESMTQVAQSAVGAVVDQGVVGALRGAAVGVARNEARSFGAAIGKGVSQGLADELEVSRIISEAFDSALASVATAAQKQAEAIASAAAELFSRGPGAGIPGFGDQIKLGDLRAGVTTSLAGISAAAEASAKAIEDAVKALFDAGGNTRALSAAQRALLEQVRVSGTGPSLDIRTVSGVSNRQAILAAGQSVKDYATELIRQGRPLNDVIEATKFYREQIVFTATAAGFSAEQVRDLLRQLGLGDSALAEFARQVKALEEEAKKASKATKELQEEEERRRAAEQAAAAEAAKMQRLQDPRFQRQIVQNVQVTLPTGDPRAAALAVANRIAMTSR